MKKLSQKREEKTWKNIRQVIKGTEIRMVKKVEKTVYIYLENGVKNDTEKLRFNKWKYLKIEKKKKIKI